jgi:hypothetical protein
MSNSIKSVSRLMVPAGQAKLAPPMGPALGHSIHGRTGLVLLWTKSLWQVATTASSAGRSYTATKTKPLPGTTAKHPVPASWACSMPTEHVLERCRSAVSKPAKSARRPTRSRHMHKMPAEEVACLRANI